MKFKNYALLGIELPYNNVGIERFTLQIKRGITNVDLADELSDDWTPQKDERLYFFPGCSVPAIKVREKFNRTIKLEYATSAFISPHTIKASDKTFDVTDNVRPLDPEVIIPWLEIIYGHKHQFVMKLKSVLLNTNQLLITEFLANKLHHTHPDDAYNNYSFAQYAKEKLDVEYAYGLLHGPKAMQLYSPTANSDISNLTCNLYSQDAVLKLLNGGSIVIDEVKYQEFLALARSQDKENTILVMELMANVDYDKSFVYLVMLLKEFGSDFYKLKQSDHVNFRGLLTYFGLKRQQFRRAHSITLDTCTEVMKKHKQFTRSNVQRLTQLFVAKGTNAYSSHTTEFAPGPVLRPDAVVDDEYEVEELELPSEEPNDNFNL